MNVRLSLILLAALGGLVAPAAAQTPRDLEVEVTPNQTLPDVRVDISLRSAQAPGVRVGPGDAGILALKEGDLALVCVQASEAGYVSIWSRTQSERRLTRIYPNERTPQEQEQRGGSLSATEERCYGGGEEGYRFRVRPPYEIAEVYVHWSEDLDAQFGAEDLPSYARGGKSLRRPYASARLRYQVVP